MSTFFGTKLAESMIPDNAIMCKQSLTQEQATVIIREGVVPCSTQAYQALEKITASLDATIPKSTRIPDELSVGDQFLVLNTEHSKFTLWTRLA
jgi:hypothetical protein